MENRRALPFGSCRGLANLVALGSKGKLPSGCVAVGCGDRDLWRQSVRLSAEPSEGPRSDYAFGRPLFDSGVAGVGCEVVEDRVGLT